MMAWRREYKDIFVFVITLLAVNYLWKFSITGDEGDTVVLLWGRWDITAPFDILAKHIAAVVYGLVECVRDTAYMVGGDTIRFASGSGTRIVWSCTAIKQSFIWLCLLLTTCGGWKAKTWYIPLGWLCIYLFNILRITLITLLIEYHPTWFEFLHTYLFKYLFYGMLFALWLLFTEKIRPRHTEEQSAETPSAD